MGGIARRLGHLAEVELRVEGTRLRADLMRHVRSPAVRMDVDAADELSFQVDEVLFASEGAVVDMRPDVLESKAWGEGNKVEVWASGAEDQPFVCLGRYELQMSVPRGGGSGRTLEVVGLDASHRLLGFKGARVFGADVPDAQIVRELAAAHGLQADVDDGALAQGKPRTKPSGTTDFAFMNEIAATARNRAGAEFRWYVRFDPKALGGKGADVLHFEPFTTDRQEKRYTFRHVAVDRDGEQPWASTLRTFEIQAGLRGVPTKLSLLYVDRSTGEDQEVVIELSDPSAAPDVLYVGAAGKSKISEEVKDGAALQLKAFGEFDDQVFGLEFASVEEAIAYGVSYFRRAQYAFAVVTGTTVGVETVRPWDLHDLKGMGARWDGRVLFTSVTHSWGGGQLAYSLSFVGQRVPDAASAPKVL